MKCEICGKEIEFSCFSNKVLCSEQCWEKNYWQELIEECKNDPHKPIINGAIYHIGDENSTSSFRGYGGRKFYIVFDDGTEIITTNLWFNTDVPEQYKDILKDNAKFDWTFLIEIPQEKEQINE